MMLLVRTPRPHPTESLFGFTLRISECNGYHTPKRVWELIGCERWRNISYRFPVEGLARILGQDSESLSGITYDAGDGSSQAFKILNHPLGEFLCKRPLRLSHPAFCAQCVAEDGFIDAFWDLSAAVACPRHGRLAVNECASCEKKMGWQRPGLLKCSCGASFSEKSSGPAATELLELLGLIRARLHNAAPTNLPNTSGLPMQQLETIPLRQLLQMLETLGEYAAQGNGRKLSSDRSAVDEAAAALSDWPHGYHRALTSMGESFRSTNPKATGLRLQFGPFYESMFKHGQFVEHADFLKEEFLNFGRQHWGHGVVDSRMERGRGSARQRYMPLAQFVREYKTSYSSAHSMIAEGRIATRRIHSSSGVRILVDLEGSELPQPTRGRITHRKAAARLGLTVSTLKELIGSGAFTNVLRCEFPTYLHLDDVDAFQARVTTLPVIERRGADVIRLDALLRMKFGNAAAKAGVVSSVLNGSLPLRGRDGSRFADLRVDKLQALALISANKTEAMRGNHRLSDCFELIGLSVPLVREAIKKQLLSTKTCNGFACVTAESINQFNLQYLCLTRLAGLLGTTSGFLLRKCREWNVPTPIVLRATGSTVAYLLPRDGERDIVQRWKGYRALNSAKRAQPSQIYAAKLQDYLNRLKQTGQQLPRRKSSVDRPVIAKACGVENRKFWKSTRVRALFAEFEAMERQYFKTEEVDELEMLRGYLSELEREGRPLPTWGAKVNLKGIAAACSLGRHIFYNRSAAAELVKSYAQRFAEQSAD